MWLQLVAAETPAPTGVSDQLIIVVGGVITAAIVALGGVLVAVVNSRSSKTTASPPAPPTSVDEHVLYERTAVHSRRLDDADERFEVMDRALSDRGKCLDEVVYFLDRNHPGWRG